MSDSSGTVKPSQPEAKLLGGAVQLAHEIFKLDPQVRVPVRDTILYLFSDEYLQYIVESGIEAQRLEDRCMDEDGEEREYVVMELGAHLRNSKQLGIDMLEAAYAEAVERNPLNGEGKDE